LQELHVVWWWRFCSSTPLHLDGVLGHYSTVEVEHTMVIDDVFQATKVEILGREKGGAGGEGLVGVVNTTLAGGASNSSDGDDVGN
jgi:hypothetical protein